MDRTEEERIARERAASAGFDLPEACVPGVADNLRLLAEHAARIDAFLAEHPEA